MIAAHAVPLGGDGRLCLDNLLPELLAGWPAGDIRSLAEAVEEVPADVEQVHVDGATVLAWPEHSTPPTGRRRSRRLSVWSQGARPG